MTAASLDEEAARPSRPGLREVTTVFARIGCLSFGGPAGQIALMHREIVDGRRWVDEPHFLAALNVAMLLPGPEAQQLATYLGWRLAGWRGGLVAGALFVLPGALLMLGLSTAYLAWRHLPVADGLLLGLKCAVLALVLQALLRIARRALSGRFAWSVAGLAFLALSLLGVPFPAVIGAAALAGFLIGPRPEVPEPAGPAAATAYGRHAICVLAIGLPLWLGPVALLALLLGPQDIFTVIAAFFSTLAIATFGGAYAVLAYVAQAAVGSFGWLTPAEMADGLGLAETTPGPLILVLQHVGFLAAARQATGLDPVAAGFAGGLLTSWVTFVPSMMWMFLAAPAVGPLRRHRPLSAALAAVTAAVVGVILSLALWFAAHVLFGATAAVALGPLSLILPVAGSLKPSALILSLGAGVALIVLDLPLLAVLAGTTLAGIATTLA